MLFTEQVIAVTLAPMRNGFCTEEHSSRFQEIKTPTNSNIRADELTVKSMKASHWLHLLGAQ
jgi:hypothetical protein